jgi:hypothetical protein
MSPLHSWLLWLGLWAACWLFALWVTRRMGR